jgi:hypothetical protein
MWPNEAWWFSALAQTSTMLHLALQKIFSAEEKI